MLQIVVVINQEPIRDGGSGPALVLGVGCTLVEGQRLLAPGWNVGGRDVSLLAALASAVVGCGLGVQHLFVAVLESIFDIINELLHYG